MTFRSVCTPGYDLTILQVNPQQARHLIKPRPFGFGIHVKIHPSQKLLDIGPLNNSIGEFAQSSFPIEKKNRHAKFHAEFALKRIDRTVMQKRAHHAAISAHVHLFNLRRLDVAVADESLHFSHCRMRQRSGWVGFNGNSWIGECPRFAEPVHDDFRVETSPGGIEKSIARFENLLGSRPTHRCKITCNNTVFCGTSRMKRLRHRSEIISKTGSLRSSDS